MSAYPVKTLWILEFHPPVNNKVKQDVDLLIPAPPNFPGKWLNTRVTTQIQAQAADYLRRIQHICDELKKQTESDQKELSEGLTIKKANELKSELSELEKLFRQFKLILKQMNKQPPPPQNELNS